MFQNEGSFINWLVISSSDPNKVSLTVKGVLTAAIPTILFVAHLAGVDAIVGQNAQSVIDAVGTFVMGGLYAVSAIVSLYGAIRKIVNSFQK